MSESTDNAFAHERAALFARHAERLSGSPAGLALCVHAAPLSEAAAEALGKGAAALGWVPGLYAFASIEGLDAQEALRLIEGIDPLWLVIADEAARTLVAQAYRAELPEQGTTRLLGRDARSFRSLSALMESQEGKRAAWALLRTLPEPAKG